MASNKPKRKKVQQPEAGAEQAQQQAGGQSGLQQKMGDALQLNLPADLAWSYNPWSDHRGPLWRHPLAALLLTLAISLIAGWSVSYPNYPQDYLDDLRYAVENGRYTSDVPVEVRVAGATPPEVLEANRLKLEQIEAQFINWPAQMLGWALLSFALLFALTATIYLPTAYRLDAAGVSVRFLGTPSQRKWSHYRNYYFHDTGVHLTTMPEPSPLDPFRGHYLRYSGNRQQVEAYIRERMKDWKGKAAAA